LHTLAFLTWAQGERIARFSLFKPFIKLSTAPAWTPPPKQEEPVVPTITFIQEKRRHDAGRTFVETDASQFTGDEPKSATMYSSLPTVAANPENPTGKVGDTPYLDGKESKVLSTESVAPSPGLPVPPAPPPKPQPPPQQVLQKPIEEVKKPADEGLKAVEEKK